MPLQLEAVQTYPIFELAQKRFELLNESQLPPGLTDKEKTKKELLESIKEKSMLPFYEALCSAGAMAADESLKASMKKTNDEELAKLEEKITDAKENLGDIEVRDALLQKAEFFNRTGDKDKTLEAYKVAFEKTVGVGARMDNILAAIRNAFFYDDKELVKKQVERAKSELSKGGDWERRNKLKVYEGTYLMISRQWKDAATLYLEAMPTFTAIELVSMKDYVMYTVLLSLVALDRKDIRTKVIHNPEILSVIEQVPHLKEFLDCFYNSKYKEFMQHFVHVIDLIRRDRYLSQHVKYFMRMMRLNAYRQFLASYKSVTLGAMSDAFGVSPDFIDSELSSFISSGKLTCKIDKVGCVIESNESDSKSQVYSEIIKQGDLLVMRMQRLSAAIDM
jgi:26S proteasome regulatory subunit N7